MAGNGLKKVGLVSLSLPLSKRYAFFLFVQATALVGYPVVHNAREVSYPLAWLYLPDQFYN